jgi:hypothetical protein
MRGAGRVVTARPSGVHRVVVSWRVGLVWMENLPVRSGYK